RIDPQLMPLAAGSRLGPYEIIAVAGAGGMGEVYKARDPRLDRTVAIKTSAEQFSNRFEGEARAIAALNHPNICQIYDVGPDYLVMEFIEGSPIAPVDHPRKLLDLAVQIAAGLAAAHAAGVTHRDLKPGNILGNAGWPGEDSRFRFGQERRSRGNGCRRRHAHYADYGSRHGGRHGGLHEPGAGQWRRKRRLPVGSILPGNRSLRTGRPPASLPARDHRGNH